MAESIRMSPLKISPLVEEISDTQAVIEAQALLPTGVEVTALGLNMIAQITSATSQNNVNLDSRVNLETQREILATLDFDLD